MTADLDTLLTALYVFVDDQILPPERRRPGRPKRLTDAELVCLAVAQVMLDCPSQARWLRFCYCRLGGMFPYLPKQPGYCKRIPYASRWPPPRSACWVSQAPVGCAVTPRMCTRRLVCSMTKNAYSWRKVMVSRWKKSQARMACAWARRNSVQDGPARRVDGSIPALFRIFQTVDFRSLAFAHAA